MDQTCFEIRCIECDKTIGEIVLNRDVPNRNITRNHIGVLGLYGIKNIIKQDSGLIGNIYCMDCAPHKIKEEEK